MNRGLLLFRTAAVPAALSWGLVPGRCWGGKTAGGTPAVRQERKYGQAGRLRYGGRVNRGRAREETRMTEYVLALDQGTTSSRAILFDASGAPVTTAQREFEQLFPRPGWVEHRPEDLWASQVRVAAEALGRAGVAPGRVGRAGITNQRETTSCGSGPRAPPVQPMCGRTGAPRGSAMN